MPTVNLTVRLFGPPHILLDGQPLTLSRRKSRALIYYLASHTTPVLRTQLLALFWPDHARSAAQQLLRTTLHGLRRELGAALRVTDTELMIVPEANVDLRRFMTELGAPVVQDGQLAAALELYRGEFLEAFELPENPEFDDWVVAEREHYRRLAVRGLMVLGQRYEARHEFDQALDIITRAIALDPLQEEVQRVAIRLQYRAGDRAGAIRRYEQLRTMLDDELGVPPMVETRALYDAIITDTLAIEEPEAPAEARIPYTTPPLTNTSVFPFIGRDKELEQLRQSLCGNRMVLVEGEPGIGKTFLAQEFLRTSDKLVLAGAARELEQAFPYHPVIEALRSVLERPEWQALAARLDLPALWLAEVARLLPELAAPGEIAEGVGRAADESRLWEGVSRFLLALARQREMIIFLDDLQWADTASLGLIGYLARRSEPGRFTLITAARPAVPRSPLATLLQTLTREARLVRLPLARLSAAETLTLAQSISPNYPAPLAEWLAYTAEGNPYIMAELVRYARERELFGPNGTFIPGAATRNNGALIVPHTVETLIQSRLSRLSESARRLLDTAVAAGREFLFDVVARASALSETAVLDALDELRAAGLIVPLDNQQYAIDHALTLEVAYREADQPRHRRLHRRIAEAIEDLYQGRLEEMAGLLAWHFGESNAPERAAPYAIQAARRAVGLAAWQEAINFYRQALAGVEQRERFGILMALGDALDKIGDSAGINDVYREAIELARASGDLAGTDAARLALGRALLQEARFAEIIALVERIRQNGHPGSAVQAELLWGIALSIEGADLAGASRHLAIAEQLCDPRADPGTFSTITFELGNVLAQQGELEGAIAHYRAALDFAQHLPSAYTEHILAYNNLAFHLHLLGDPSAIEYARAGMHLVQKYGILNMQPYVHSTLGEIALAHNDLDTAEQQFSEGLALSERLSIPERIAGLTANLGLVAIQRSQITLAVHRLSAAQAQADALGLPHMAAQIRVWLAPLLPTAEARSSLAEARAIAETGGRKRLLEAIVQLEAQLNVTI